MTVTASPLVFRMATAPDELDQVHRLNYRTFAEEIPQHARNDAGILVDRFDEDNAYLICKRGTRVVGMVAIRDQRPFSLDAKVPNLDAHLPAGNAYCEVRLLAVEREHRNGIVFRGLLGEVARYCAGLGIDAAVISGAVRQLRLYEHMGFIPFGPRVGTAAAPYQPMYITLREFQASGAHDAASGNGTRRSEALSFLPGPVDVHDDVRRAYAEPPMSHRDPRFVAEVQETKRNLCALTQATDADILVGSGTLGNDVVAAQLTGVNGPGLVLSNGEFGERLVDHARRARLEFAVERLPWGEAFDAAALARAATRHGDARWWWMVHHETSTSVLNDLVAAKEAAAACEAMICADCVSSVGLVPLNLNGVHLASGASGKALGAYAGLAMVFRGGRPLRGAALPRYLDLALYSEAGGVPFTQPSGLMRALGVAVRRRLRDRDRATLGTMSAWVRAQLTSMGFRLVAPDRVASPGIATIALREGQSSKDFGDALAASGFAVSYRSCYLRDRNWIQIAFMGEAEQVKLTRLLAALRRLRASGPSHG